jgi:hypothetical protein
VREQNLPGLQGERQPGPHNELPQAARELGPLLDGDTRTNAVPRGLDRHGASKRRWMVPTVGFSVQDCPAAITPNPSQRLSPTRKRRRYIDDENIPRLDQAVLEGICCRCRGGICSRFGIDHSGTQQIRLHHTTHGPSTDRRRPLRTRTTMLSRVASLPTCAGYQRRCESTRYTGWVCRSALSSSVKVIATNVPPEDRHHRCRGHRQIAGCWLTPSAPNSSIMPTRSSAHWGGRSGGAHHHGRHREPAARAMTDGKPKPCRSTSGLHIEGLVQSRCHRATGGRGRAGFPTRCP